MEFPFVVMAELSERQKLRYRRHVDCGASGWHRRWTESVWRRHQHESNARLSGWTSPADRRRRLIHFYDEYGMQGDAFLLKHSYVWVNLTLPDEEVGRYRASIHDRLASGGWACTSRTGAAESWSRASLQATLTLVRLHEEDEARGYALPADYCNLTLVVATRGIVLPAGLEKRPWRWFHEVGLREIAPRGEPLYIEPEALAAFFPAQLEMGCGPSTEAGVPHLSTLHRIYGVSRGDFSFVFEPEEDGLLDILSAPEVKYAEFTRIYKACMAAEPTAFHRGIRTLADKGLVVGPVITNNFDFLCADVGLEEVSLRRYESDAYFPMPSGAGAIAFDPRARSLLVVGVHADRRLAQRRAREQGLTIVYIDPERYLSPSGAEIPYPVEAPQTGDRLVKLPASEALIRLVNAL
ncbi:MAG: hypothetical protein QOJ27_1372 [Sphingomonadales bacterium]|nr:hypothetical protein [Sphingomonadales bacterium]